MLSIDIVPNAHHHRLLRFHPSSPPLSSLPCYHFRLSFLTRLRPSKIICCLSLHRYSSTPTTTATSAAAPHAATPAHPRVVFAAGGTGGHIIPAVAIADELKTSNPNAQILFIGTPNSMESSSIPSAGYPFSSIPPIKLHRPLFSLRNLSLPFHLIQSTIHSLNLLEDFKPDIVIGTGGYVSFPTCLAAAFKRIKIVIQEQNSVPGIANSILSSFAEVVFVAYNSTVECFSNKHKCVVSGNPVRLSLRQQSVSKASAMKAFFPRFGGKEGGKLILVLGGSFGANTINIALLHKYSQMLLQNKNWLIIWQTGVEAFNEMESLVRTHPRLVLTP